jgi:hypothetical protein
MPIRALCAQALLIAAWLLPSGDAQARCGAENQVPCKVWERVPSCDKGLVEHFGKNRCLRPAARTPCGADGQRPCTVVERIPSCDTNLVEDFGKNRCVRPGCGRLNGAPCKVWERVPSCDRGLAEDFLQGRCVQADLRASLCKALVSAMRSGRSVPGLELVLPKARERQQGVDRRVQADLMNRAAAFVQPHAAHVPEMRRIGDFLAAPANRAALESIFSADNFCGDSIADMDRKLARLGLVPSFSRNQPRKVSTAPESSLLAQAEAESPHFYMGYQLTFALGVGIGAQGGLLGVTDFGGRGAKYWFIGPQLESNIAGGVGVQVIFFPAVTLQDFDGWGFGAGISGGPPTKIVSVAIDLMVDEKLSKIQGFGVGPGLGLGAIPGDIGVSATHSWRY